MAAEDAVAPPETLVQFETPLLVESDGSKPRPPFSESKSAGHLDEVLNSVLPPRCVTNCLAHNARRRCHRRSGGGMLEPRGFPCLRGCTCVVYVVGAWLLTPPLPARHR